MADLGRNDPCHCNSGKKYKKCCEAKDSAKKHAELEKTWNKTVKEFEKQKKEDEEKNPDAKAPVPEKHQTHPVSNVKLQRHASSVAPKFSMPRKSGGGGA